MTTTLNFNMRHWMIHLRDDGRLAVLINLMLHANVRNRTWPSNELIIKETGWSANSVTNAIRWLRDHEAIELVLFKKRVGNEQSLPPRQYVYQLTGTIRLDGITYDVFPNQSGGDQ